MTEWIGGYCDSWRSKSDIPSKSFKTNYVPNAAEKKNHISLIVRSKCTCRRSLKSLYDYLSE